MSFQSHILPDKNADEGQRALKKIYGIILCDQPIEDLKSLKHKKKKNLEPQVERLDLVELLEFTTGSFTTLVERGWR